MKRFDRTWVLFSLCAAYAALSACSGGGDQAIPLSELPQRTAQTVCAFGVQCGQFPDKVTCASSIQVNLAQLTADVMSGKINYDGSAAQDCLAAIGVSELASCKRSGASTLPEPRCSDAFLGTVAAGEPCFVDEECASLECDRTACAGVTGCCAGACRAPIAGGVRGPVALGAECVDPAAPCGQDAYCLISPASAGTGSSTGTCTARTAVGQPCGFSDQCVPGSFCFFDSSVAGMPGVEGACRLLSASGQPCTAGSGNSMCDSVTDFCDPVSLKCVARVKVGGGCTSDGDCVGFAFCDPGIHLCVARGAAGSTCDPAGGAHCLGSLTCIGGQCSLTPQTTCP